MDWNIGQAQERFSELVRDAAGQPQKIYRSDRLVAAVIDPATLEEFLTWKRQRELRPGPRDRVRREGRTTIYEIASPRLPGSVSYRALLGWSGSAAAGDAGSATRGVSATWYGVPREDERTNAWGHGDEAARCFTGCRLAPAHDEPRLAGASRP